MNRRKVLGAIAAGAATIAASPLARAAADKSVIPGAIDIAIGQKIRIGAQSSAVATNGGELHIISIGEGIFTLDGASRLSAVLKAGVKQYARIDYWIYAAVFDGAGKFLGAAAHKEVVDYVRLAGMPMMFRDIDLDFGISLGFKDAAVVTIAISDSDVPRPD